jgi:hypothetical protein
MTTRPADATRRILIWAAVAVGAGVSIYLLLAYVLLPGFWELDTRRAVFEDLPGVTRTRAGIPADPLNIALAGEEAILVRCMLDSDWHPADPTTLETALHIAESAILHRPYADAPVSNLYLYGRKQDLAFEQPVGGDARRRHHVRFWRAPKTDEDGRRLWIGAATFDVRVGLSETTGQITHHIAPEIDEERDKLLRDLQRTGCIESVLWIDDFHEQRSGRNGSGDEWHTDGRLVYAALEPFGVSSP